MFFAEGTLSVGGALFRSHLAVDRGLRLFAVDQRGVVFDTRFLPPSEAEEREVSVLWLVQSGTLAWRGSSFGSVDGPGAIAFAEHHLDGARGRRELTFRTSSAPFCSLEIRVPRARMRIDTSTGPQLVHPGGPSWRAIEQYLSRVFAGPSTLSLPHVLEVLECLAGEHVIRPEVCASVVREEDPRLVRLWNELARAYARFDTRPSLKRLAWATGMSLRNLSRLVTLTSRELLLPPGSWRDSTANLRLNMAILFLSSPSLSVAEVSKVAGYSHAQAMTNAFQRAGLLSPRDLRQAVAGEPHSERARRGTS